MTPVVPKACNSLEVKTEQQVDIALRPLKSRRGVET